jgi:DNA-directed RNA polymerase I, II, and III subunit RPABC1
MSESTGLAKARKTMVEMLTDRGYKNINTDLDQSLIICDQVLVYFTTEKSVTINTVKNFIVMLNDREKTGGILVYPNTITPSAKKAVEVIDKTIELFNVDELQYNLTHHVLVPKHQLATCEELGATKRSQLPVMLSSDPVCRYYSFKKGDIIRITRTSGVVAYRYVK